MERTYSKKQLCKIFEEHCFLSFEGDVIAEAQAVAILGRQAVNFCINREEEGCKNSKSNRGRYYIIVPYDPCGRKFSALTFEGFCLAAAAHNIISSLEYPDPGRTTKKKNVRRPAGDIVEFRPTKDGTICKPSQNAAYPNLETERVKKGMSKAELAATIGVSYATVTNWQSGKSEIPASAIAALAELFGVTADYLLGRTNFKMNE
ncbi:MAG: helix-turn-helix domain-containing protein [Clostridiales bacterium]|nr:helix-turn-helix domain-containing protein [Clostridiales bacterium]